MSELRPTIESLKWYTDFFYGSDHMNYGATDTPLGPVLVSAVRENHSVHLSIYRVIIRTREVCAAAAVATRSLQ